MKTFTDLLFNSADIFVLCFVMLLFASREIHLIMLPLFFVLSLLLTPVIMFIERLL